MKIWAIIYFVGISHCFVVKRDADADPDNLGLGYGTGIVTGGVTGVSPTQVSQPVCNSVPQKVCKDRTVETPRKVCHTEHDEIIDTTITEHCEERITTKCEQVSSQTRHSSAVVGADSKVVATGIVASGEATVGVGPSVVSGSVSGYSAGGALGASGIIGAAGAVNAGGLAVGSGYADGYGYSGIAKTYSGYTKRDADADAFTAGVVANTGVSPVSTSAPVCHSVPVRTCNNVPVNTPRKVAKTVCKTVVDIKIIKDCTDTISTTCTQQSVQQSQSSAVVGSHSRDGPYAVVANHGTVATGSPVPHVGGYTTGPVIGGATIGAGGIIGGTTGSLSAPLTPIAAASAPIVNSAPIASAAPIATTSYAAAPIAAAPIVAAPIAAAPVASSISPALSAEGAKALSLAKAGLVAHPNGAVVPIEPADVAAARAEHLAAVAAA